MIFYRFWTDPKIRGLSSEISESGPIPYCGSAGCGMTRDWIQTENRLVNSQKLSARSGMVHNSKVGIWGRVTLGWPDRIRHFPQNYHCWNAEKSSKKCQNRRKQSILAIWSTSVPKISLLRDPNGPVTPASFSLMVVLKIPSDIPATPTTFGG